ncbi:MAG: ABC transporter permease [Marmoricola sp.]
MASASREHARGSPAGRVPWPLGVPALVGAAFLLVPLVALLVRAPWHGMADLVRSGPVLDALRLSLVSATLATAVALVLGVPLAFVLARSSLPGTGILRALVTLPLVMPPVVGGVALLYALGRNGLVGQWLDQWFGLTVPFTPGAVVIAEAFVAMPFLVVTVEGAVRARDRGFEEAAATLGASRLRTFWRVTLPLVRPPLVAGAVLCWARALGEFGATITFAGNVPGRTQTMPLATYIALQTNPQAATALALVLLAVSAVVLVALRERWFYAGGRQ